MEVIKRHWFITFWLWFGIIVNIIMIPCAIMAYSNLGNLGYYGIELQMKGMDLQPFRNHIGTLRYLLSMANSLSAVLFVMGYRILLGGTKIAGMKKGFSLIAITTIIVGVLNFVILSGVKNEYATLGLEFYSAGQATITLLSVPFNILILWVILQIRKDGVSYWSQLW